jgi:hypothetical protein
MDDGATFGAALPLGDIVLENVTPRGAYWWSSFFYCVNIGGSRGCGVERSWREALDDGCVQDGVPF